MKRLSTVEVVAINHGERNGELIARRVDRVRGSPGLNSRRRRVVCPGQVVEALIHKAHVHIVGYLPGEKLLNIAANLLAHNKHNAAKSALKCIVKGVIDQRLTVRADAFNLLDTAEAASHSCCQNQKTNLGLALIRTSHTHSLICVQLRGCFEPSVYL